MHRVGGSFSSLAISLIEQNTFPFPNFPSLHFPYNFHFYVPSPPPIQLLSPKLYTSLTFSFPDSQKQFTSWSWPPTSTKASCPHPKPSPTPKPHPKFSSVSASMPRARLTTSLTLPLNMEARRTRVLCLICPGCSEFTLFSILSLPLFPCQCLAGFLGISNFEMAPPPFLRRLRGLET